MSFSFVPSEVGFAVGHISRASIPAKITERVVSFVIIFMAALQTFGTRPDKGFKHNRMNCALLFALSIRKTDHQIPVLLRDLNKHTPSAKLRASFSGRATSI